ncbi:alpha/beta hydrolase [Candidatus Saccharibacteria bacterium]|nr:alpha/beta hydrolase [Candidatus Saccharibacteria bacterium]
MAKRKKLNPADYIVPININNMNGRMLRMPSQKSKANEILVIYGMHASIERMFGFAEELNKYGTVTIPDLPGFGGMDPLYKIGEKATLDNLADYLTSFVKLRYKKKRVTIIAMSYGFLVVTRMLQKYPEISKKIELLVSLVGFVHYEDFHIKRSTLTLIKMVSKFGSYKLPAFILKTLVFRGPQIKFTYRIIAKNHRKLYDADEVELEKRINFETELWKINDVRTRARVANDMFKVDLCKTRVNLPVTHVAIANDHFFDNGIVEQHMNIIYSNVTVITADMKGHAPTVVADAATAAAYLPKELRKLLSRKK